jgi:hypothetical protein
LKNNIFNETLLKKVNEINNKYASSKTSVFGVNLELEEKEIFYNKTNQIEKRYVIKKDYLKRNFEYLTFAFQDKINNDNFKNFINLNKNFESRTLSDIKQPEDCLMQNKNTIENDRKYHFLFYFFCKNTDIFKNILILK